jgi:acyl-CoA thioester hydrolase
MAEAKPRPAPLGRDAFARFVPLSTRWADNDPYGHINNAAYHYFFDTAVNAVLIEAGLLDPASSPVIGLVVENSCVYFSSVAFPDAIEVGIAVEELGRSSVRYLVSAFKAGAPLAAAQGRYTHVYVDRASQRPTPIPAGHRRLMESLRVGEPQSGAD